MYISHIAPLVLQWSINETVILNGSTNGSCMATSNPRPLLVVKISGQCDYQTKFVTIDDFTAAVEFKISPISEECENISCLATNHPHSLTYSKTLNIITGNAYISTIIKMNINFFQYIAFDTDDVKSQNTNKVIPVNTTTPITATNDNNITITQEDEDAIGGCKNTAKSATNIVLFVLAINILAQCL